MTLRRQMVTIVVLLTSFATYRSATAYPEAAFDNVYSLLTNELLWSATVLCHQGNQ